jgi:hypothetical protein
MTADPALGSYLPSAANPNASLPGLGGAFQPANLALYGYSHNNPATLRDPNGFEPESADKPGFFRSILNWLATPLRDSHGNVLTIPEVTPESCFVCAVAPDMATADMWAHAEYAERPATRGDIVGGILEIAGAVAPIGRGGGKIVGESATVLSRGATLSEGAVAAAARAESAAARVEGPAARAANLVERVIGDCGSFAEATPVTTLEGLKPIGELKTGDRVLAQDEETGTYAFEPITQVFRHQDPVKVYLTVEEPATGLTEVIETTPDHPFHVPGRGFVPAGSLKSDDTVSRAATGASSVVRLMSARSGTSEVLRVKNLTFENEPFWAYNLEVGEDHTFFVGTTHAWVHNGPCLPELKISASKYPELAANIRKAQQAGHPDVLRHGGEITKNRAAALKGVRKVKGMSRDEYPFASSMEGGGGAWVGQVPVSQQHAQGALMTNFVKANNIKPGDQYRVVIVK